MNPKMKDESTYLHKEKLEMISRDFPEIPIQVVQFPFKVEP